MKEESWKEEYWTDNKGRQVLIHTMSNRWLNNIRKSCKTHPKIQLIKDEIKRRRNKWDKNARRYNS